ncbi:MAG TPA: hypothetical protein VIX59_01595 [Candidatus Binataceae bacterium]
MIEANLEGVESLRVLRASGNLKLKRADGAALLVECDESPEVRRNAGKAEVQLRSNAELRIPAGVAVEIVDCAGNLDAEDISAPLLIGRVRGNFRSRRIGPLKVVSVVAGNFEAEGAHAIELAKVAGNARISDVEKTVRIEAAGGNLEARNVGAVEAGTVGGRARMSDVGGAIKIDTVGGRFKADGVGGDIAVETVGGHASVVNARGALLLPRVGGAIDLSGPFPPAQRWSVKCRGRASVQLDENASIDLAASAGWGRVRLYGADASSLKWVDRNRAEGKIGVERPDAERLRLSIETSGADVIISGPDAAPHDFFFRVNKARFGRSFAAPFEMFAEEIGEEIPGFVNAVMGAVGRFASDAGAFSGKIAADVTRELNSALNEIERALDEVGERIPGDVSEKVAKLGREIAEMVAKAIKEGRCRTRDEGREMRERVREAAREMRDTIRQAARDLRTGSDASERSAQEPRAQEHQEGARARRTPGATVPLDAAARQSEILEILKKVKEGKLQPEEADDLISAWMEVDPESSAEKRSS